MSTYTKTATLNAPELALANMETAAEKFNAATEHLTLATRTVLMVAATPLIGLAFILALPILSVMLTAYYGMKLMAARWAGVARYVKNVTLFLIAPVVGLGYIIALPFVGFGMLCYLGVKAARK
jgi:hypothetical protein